MSVLQGCWLLSYNTAIWCTNKYNLQLSPLFIILLLLSNHIDNITSIYFQEAYYFTRIVGGDDISELLVRDRLPVVVVLLLEFIYHGDNTVETFGNVGPNSVLEEHKRQSELEYSPKGISPNGHLTSFSCSHPPLPVFCHIST